jgi:hypothetical protein
MAESASVTRMWNGRFDIRQVCYAYNDDVIRKRAIISRHNILFNVRITIRKFSWFVNSLSVFLCVCVYVCVCVCTSKMTKTLVYFIPLRRKFGNTFGILLPLNEPTFEHFEQFYFCITVALFSDRALGQPIHKPVQLLP